METRDQYPDSQGHKGVETVMFNSASERLGKIDHVNFETQWQRIQARVYGGKCPSWPKGTDSDKRRAQAEARVL